LQRDKEGFSTMNKGLIYLVSGALLLSSCGTWTGNGAGTGAYFGSILGSAIGGIAGGPRGSDIGTIVGMAGGAAVGAAIGAQADQTDAQRVHDHYDRIQQNKDNGYNPYDHNRNNNYDYNDGSTYNYNDDNAQPVDPQVSGFDSTNSGDDRITITPSDSTDDYTAAQPATVVPGSTSHIDEIPAGALYTPNIEIANPRFVDANKDGFLSRNENAKVTFEIYNRGSQPLYNVIPSVIETSGNRHISITPSIIVESLAPGRGITYTAFIKADNRLGDGNAKFALAVLQGKKSISKVTEFDIRTRK